MYLTYDEYFELGGALDETTFSQYEWKARAKVNYYTFNRLVKDTTISEGVKHCIFDIIAYMYELDNQLSANSAKVVEDGSGEITGLAIKSQSNDGVSIAYNILTADKYNAQLEKNISDTIKTYLEYEVNELGRKLLYRGYYPGE